MRLRWLVRAALFAALTIPFCASGFAEEPKASAVDIRAGNQDDHSRITFFWSKPVKFSASGDGRTILIQFDRPLSAALERIPMQLSETVSRAALEPDGRTVRLELVVPADVRTNSKGRIAVVDLFPRPERPTVQAVAAVEPAAGKEAKHKGAAATKVASAGDDAAAAATASTPFMSIVPREFGEFSRLMFDWDRVVDYQVTREGSDLVIRFATNAMIEPIAKGTALPRRIKSVDVASEKTATVVRIRTKSADARLRHFQRGNRIVVDLLGGASEENDLRPGWAAQESVTLDELAKAKPQPEQKVADAGTSVAAAASPVPPAADQAQANARGQADHPLPPPPPLEPLPSITQPTPGTDEPVPGPAAPAEELGPVAAAPAEAPLQIAPPPAPELTSIVPTEASPEIQAQPSEVAPAVEPLAVLPPLRPSKVATPPAQVADAPPPALVVTAEAIENGVRLKFPFTAPTASAVFRRMGNLWVVFDRPIELDLSKLEPTGPMANSFSGAEQIAHDNATVLRLSPANGVGAQVVRSGNVWSVELTRTPAPVLRPVSPAVEALRDGGQRIVLSMPKPAQPVRLTDPEVGDTIVALPSAESGAAVGLGRSYVQFSLLPSAQGAAILPQDDGIEFAIAADRIVIGGAGDLQVSPEAAYGAVFGSDPFAEPASMTRSFDYERWRRSDLGTFNRARQKLQIAAAEASGVTRSARRVDLARFFVAHGMAADALGVIDRIAAEDPKRANEADFVALRGAARLLSGRLVDAARDLNAAELDNDADVLLWRAALAASRGDYEVADSQFQMSGGALKALPDEIGRRFKLLAAHAALAVKNYHRAGQLIAELKESSKKPAEKSEIEYLEAQLLERNDKPAEALNTFKSLSGEREGPVGVRASLAAVDLELKDGKITPREAIKELEALRTAWRGDGFEQQLLKRLSELYLGEKDYLNGLGALRDAIERFPKSNVTAGLQQKLYQVMDDLFVAGNADALTPLAALSLYYEFEESAPAGSAGGRIVEGLANKLVAIDLLDRAAALLHKQVDKLDGADRARLGTRFASVKLLDDDAEQALAMLRRTETKGLPAALKFERARVAAQVSEAMGKPAEALGLIAGDTSREAELLRADLQWDAKEWPAVAETIDRLYPEGSTDLSALTPDDHDLLMRAAVARSLAGDKEGVAALRTRFGEAMKLSAYAGAFEFITSPVEHPDAKFEDLPKLLADTGGIDGVRMPRRSSPAGSAPPAAEASKPDSAKPEAPKPTAQAQ